ncbi:DUF4864 domain-containing protein [Phycobacter sp. K97]|uniref:DUF4864 domain-containing protein n=1 Tax=Phycobacter sedimenti TaxID=3133977 RepID=UPI00311F4054
MLRFISVFFFLVAWGFPAAATEQGRIKSVIAAQIEAFRAEDYSAAFDHASPSIQNLFGTAETFGEMVERGYPMVLSPAEVRYLGLREVAGLLWQRVLIRDRDGRLHLLDYQMVDRGSDWKINAVQILRAPEGSA